MHIDTKSTPANDHVATETEVSGRLVAAVPPAVEQASSAFDDTAREVLADAGISDH
jgi:hypothetical protein